MSDYFGALLRSAGAVRPDADAHAMPADGDDLVEQEIEVEAGAAAPAAHSPEVQADMVPAPQSRTDSISRANILPREEARREPAPSPGRGPALDEEMHPVVRAALRWVATDPAPAERAVTEAAAVQPAGDPSSRRSPNVTPRARAVRPQQVVPPGRIAPDAGPAPDRAVAAPHPSPTRELDLTLPRAARMPPQATPTLPQVTPTLPQVTPTLPQVTPTLPQVTPTLPQAVAIVAPTIPGPTDRVEVSIGTIHVRVDAPPTTRAAVEPPPPPQRPQAPRTASPSGFARSRLPRI